MKLYSKILLFLAFLATTTSIFAQEAVFQTFKDTRVINAQTVEVLPWGKMDFRIGHRFGDIAGDAGGWQTFYGLEQATDVNFGFEYGFRQNLTLGLFRAKGAGPTRSNVVGSVKYKLMSQGENSMPITATLLGVSSMSTMKKSSDSSSISSFPKFTNRMSYSVQLLLARKFGNRFSLQLMPGYTYRNLVQYDDQNGFFTMGAAAKIQLNKANGIIFDATLPLTNKTYGGQVRTPSIGIGWEIETGGHVFQLNFTNAKGIHETDYIPYTSSKWSQGQFRLGFTVARRFSI
jgi:hypothetical protein